MQPLCGALLLRRHRVSAAQPQPSVTPATLVLTNGKIVTVSDQLPEAQAMAVNGDYRGATAYLNALAAHLKDLTGVRLNPDALFDVQVKRIHEYKRQLLNILETIALYNEMRAHPERDPDRATAR